MAAALSSSSSRDLLCVKSSGAWREASSRGGGGGGWLASHGLMWYLSLTNSRGLQRGLTPQPLPLSGFANRALILSPTEFGIDRTRILSAKEQADGRAAKAGTEPSEGLNTGINWQRGRKKRLVEEAEAQRGLFSEIPSPVLPCQSTRVLAFQPWAGGRGGPSITNTMGTQGRCPRSGCTDTHLLLPYQRGRV